MILAGLPLAGTFTHLVRWGADDVLGGLADAVSAAASAVMAGIGTALADTTRPELGARWFGDQYGQMAGLAVVGLLVLVPMGVVQGIVRQDPLLLVRAVLVQLPLAVLLTMSAVWLVNLGLGVVDWMCAAVAHDAPRRAADYLGRLVTSLPVLAGGSRPPVFLTLLFSLIVVVGGFVLWLEMVVRSAAIYLATVFLPIALVGLVWPAASRWARRLAEVLVALVLSKFVVVATLSLGAAAVTGGGGASAALLGMALLILATAAPFAVLKLVPLAEFGAVAHLEGMGRRAVAGGPASAWTLKSHLSRAVAGASPGAPPVPPEGSSPARGAQPNWHQPIRGLVHPTNPALDGTRPEPDDGPWGDGGGGPGPHSPIGRPPDRPTGGHPHRPLPAGPGPGATSVVPA